MLPVKTQSAWRLLMYNLRAFLTLLWRQLAVAGLASGHHPDYRKPPSAAAPRSPVGLQAILDRHHQIIPRLDQPIKSLPCYLLGYSRLPLTDRALITLRSAHISKAHYLLPGLVANALDHGLTPSDIKLIARGRQAPGWSARERLLIQITDDLYRKRMIMPVHWKRLRRLYHPDQILDIVLNAAAFHLCTRHH